jgi:hypothetical protein
MAKPEIPCEQVPTHDSLGGCLANLFWLIACPGALVMTAMGIAAGGRHGLQWLDILYWTVVPLAPVARWAEARIARRRGANSEPDAAGSWRRYALGFAVVAAGLWLVAHAAAYVAHR